MHNFKRELLLGQRVGLAGTDLEDYFPRALQGLHS